MPVNNRKQHRNCRKEKMANDKVPKVERFETPSTANNAGEKLDERPGDQPTNQPGDQSGEKNEHRPRGLIKLRFRNNARYQHETRMEAPRTQPMRGVMDAFAATLDQGIAPLRFLTWDGQLLNGDETPEELELEEDDIIDVLEEMTGGK